MVVFVIEMNTSVNTFERRIAQLTMKLTFLGTGDFYPRSLGHNSALLEWNGHRLAIDFPASNAYAIERLGLSLEDVPNVFISHLHEDHINGIQQYAYWHDIYNQMHKRDNKPNLYIASDLIDELWQTVRSGLSKTTKGERTLHDYFNVHAIPVPDGTFELGGITFQIVKTQHVPAMSTYGIVAEPYFYFSCDARVDEVFLSSISREVYTIFHDCHLWDLRIQSHASLQDIKSLSPEIQSQIVLMHYNYNYETEESRQQFTEKERIRLASPLASYTFR